MQATGTFRNRLGDVKNFMGQIEEEFKEVAQKAVDAGNQVTGSLQRVATSAGKSIEIPEQLKGAWNTLLARLRARPDFAPRQEMDQLKKEFQTLRRRMARLERRLPAAPANGRNAGRKRSAARKPGPPRQ